MAHRSGDSHDSTDCFCPFGQQTQAACWTDFLSLSVSLSLRLFSAFVSASLLCHLPYSFAFPPSPPPPFPPFLGPAQRAEGRGQAGVSRTGRLRRPHPTTLTPAEPLCRVQHRAHRLQGYDCVSGGRGIIQCPSQRWTSKEQPGTQLAAGTPPPSNKNQRLLDPIPLLLQGTGNPGSRLTPSPGSRNLGYWSPLFLQGPGVWDPSPQLSQGPRHLG